MSYFIKFGTKLYLQKDGEPKSEKVNGQTIFTNGYKITNDRTKAIEFESITEASHVQSQVGFRGTRGNIVNADKDRKKYPDQPKLQYIISAYKDAGYHVLDPNGTELTGLTPLEEAIAFCVSNKLNYRIVGGEHETYEEDINE